MALCCPGGKGPGGEARDPSQMPCLQERPWLFSPPPRPPPHPGPSHHPVSPGQLPSPIHGLPISPLTLKLILCTAAFVNFEECKSDGVTSLTYTCYWLPTSPAPSHLSTSFPPQQLSLPISRLYFEALCVLADFLCCWKASRAASVLLALESRHPGAGLLFISDARFPWGSAPPLSEGVI